VERERSGGLHWHGWRKTGKQDHPFVRRKG